MAGPLSADQAFAPGSDLWIVPDPDDSQWTTKIDWYLNFQILRGLRHQPPDRPAELEGLLKEIDWTPQVWEPKADAPLMIGVDGRLPARWLVVLPWAGELDSWAARISEIGGSLGASTLRVFLPAGITPLEWGKAAASLPLKLEATLVTAENFPQA